MRKTTEAENAENLELPPENTAGNVLLNDNNVQHTFLSTSSLASIESDEIETSKSIDQKDD